VDPDSADGVYASIEHALSEGRVSYDIRSSIPDHELRKEGNSGAGESVRVDIGQSSFTVGWSALSTFSVPTAALDVLSSCLRPAQAVSLQASMELGQVPEALLRAGDGLLVKKLLVTIFELAAPNVEAAVPGGREVPFMGMAYQAGEEAGSLIIFGELESDAPSAPKAIEYMLVALSKYCEVYGR